jgi:hypothetical protein
MLHWLQKQGMHYGHAPYYLWTLDSCSHGETLEKCDLCDFFGIEAEPMNLISPLFIVILIIHIGKTNQNMDKKEMSTLTLQTTRTGTTSKSWSDRWIVTTINPTATNLLFSSSLTVMPFMPMSWRSHTCLDRIMLVQIAGTCRGFRRSDLPPVLGFWDQDTYHKHYSSQFPITSLKVANGHSKLLDYISLDSALVTHCSLDDGISCGGKRQNANCYHAE